MIPTVAAADTDYNIETTIAEQPSKTYWLRLDAMRITGTTDGQEAMKIAIFKGLQTERYQYPIYSNNYGIELLHVIGQPIPYVLAEVERVVREALLWDSRILSVHSFEFEKNKSAVHVTFKANTIFGETSAEIEVNF